MKKCTKTISGKHVWEVIQYVIGYTGYYGNINITNPMMGYINKCVACGKFDDTKKVLKSSL